MPAPTRVDRNSRDWRKRADYWEGVERTRESSRAIARMESEIAEAARRGEPNPYADAEVPF